MGRYNVKSKQDLSGIATLTNDPIAIDNLKHEQNAQADNELEKTLSRVAACIEEVKQEMLESLGIPKEVFEE